MARYIEYGFATATCPSQFIESHEGRFLLDLRDDSTASVSYSLTVHQQVETACLKEIPTECGALVSSADERCALAGCGLCDCAAANDLELEDVEWVLGDTLLRLASTSRLFDFCVNGDSLELRDNNPDQARYALERVYRGSHPTPCKARDADSCTLGNGCHVGSCSGPGKCAEYSSEAECDSGAGCSWSSDGCSGRESYCHLSDYEVVPGCEFRDAPADCAGTPCASALPHCAGEPTPCATLAPEQCSSELGCFRSPGCGGGGTIRCSDLSVECEACDMIEGCSCGSAGCEGTTSCEDLLSTSTCAQFEHCTWGECSGRPVGCDGLAESLCNRVPGCAWQPFVQPEEM